jgi:hypothetical protein
LRSSFEDRALQDVVERYNWVRGLGLTPENYVAYERTENFVGGRSRHHCVDGRTEHRKAIVAAYNPGARTANIIAALLPERCKAMVSVNGYLINKCERDKLSLPPKASNG